MARVLNRHAGFSLWSSALVSVFSLLTRGGPARR